MPRAYRTPLHLLTASGRLAELTRFLNWLTGQGVTSLGDLDTSHCEAYLAHRRYLLDENGHVAGERSPATRRAAAQTIVDLVNHRELFTLDRVPGDLRPWGGAAPSAVAEMPCGTGQNKTPPVGDSVLQPMLAAARYLVDTLGPHAIELIQQVRDADRRWSHAHGDHVFTSRLPAEEITQLLADYEHRQRAAAPGGRAHHPGPAGRRLVTGGSADSRSPWDCWPVRPGSPSSGGSGSRTCATGSRRP